MEIQKIKDVVILRLTSQDLAAPQETSEIVEQLLTVDGERKFVADLSAIDQISSLQVGAVVTLHLLCYENLAILKLAGVHERVKTVLKLVGLHRIMEMHHGPDVARASFGESASESE
ncbi:MAG: STAS domain-containing protein [Planctomycetota bacterium]|nr:STAS domain-containing protein [Planctomycetota bacterium]